MIRNQHSKISLADNKSLSLYDEIDKDSTKEIEVSKNAVLNYVKYTKADVKFKLQVKADENSTVNIFIYQDRSGINEIMSCFKGKKASINIYILNVLDENQKAENILRTVHDCESYSDIKVVNILDGSSIANIDMLTNVNKGGSFSKAFQNSKTILLSDDAVIKATPHLEIFIDELEASHGASCGELDEKSLFYLRSRGISEDRAKQMLLEALKIELIENIKDEKTVEFAKELIVK